MPTKKKSTIINGVMAKKRSQVHYVDNEKFYQEMKEFIPKYKEAQAKGIERPPIPNSIGESILKIAQRLASLPNFYSYPYREEMIADAVEQCIRYIGNFDPDRFSNPFSYFTQTCYFQFLQRIKLERNAAYLRARSMLDVMDNVEDSVVNPGLHFHNKNYDELGEIAKFVDEYETKNGIKKRRAAKSTRQKKFKPSKIDLSLFN